MFTMKFELSFCGKSYSSAFLFQILMRKNGQQVFAYVWFLIFQSREMLSTILTYYVFRVNVFSETTASFLLSLFVSVALYMWRAMRKKTVIFFINWNGNSLQIAKFNVFFVICPNATNIFISFENSSFNNYFSNIVSIVVVVFNSPFNRNAFLSGLNCLLRTSSFVSKISN